MADLIPLSYATTMIPGLAPGPLAALPSAISAASDIIRDYCRRDFTQATYTELYDGDGTASLFLTAFPVQSIASITVGLPDAPVVLDPSAYGFKARTGEVRMTGQGTANDWEAWGPNGNFPEGWQNVQVVYTAGNATIPTPVQQACVVIAKALIDNAKRDNSVDAERWEDYSFVRNQLRKDVGIPETTKDMLAPYRDYRV